MIINKQIRIDAQIWESMQNVRKEMMKRDKEVSIIKFMSDAIIKKIEEEKKKLEEVS